jgi:hypothetical protein
MGSFQVVQQLYNLRRFRTAVRLPLQGTVIRIGHKDLERVTLKGDEQGGFEMKIRHKPLTSVAWFTDRNPAVVLSGDDAIRAARHLLPQINRAGGSKNDVKDAVRALEQEGNSHQLFATMATRFRSTRLQREPYTIRWPGGRSDGKLDGSAVLKEMPASIRLALEMSLHEEDERRALEGELYLLEDRWREAEEVAAISDDMFLPSGVSAMLAKFKKGG